MGWSWAAARSLLDEYVALQGEMETTLIDVHNKVKGELRRRKEIARELARLEIQSVYAGKVQAAQAAVEQLRKELRELNSRVRWPEGAGRGAASASTLGAVHSGRVRAGKHRREGPGMSVGDLEDSVLGALQASNVAFTSFAATSHYSLICGAAVKS